MNFWCKENNRVFINFLSTYIVIVIVVATFFYPIYQTTLKVVKENAVKDRFKTLEENFRKLDNELIKMQELAIVLRNDVNFSNIVKLTDDEISTDKYFTMYMAQKYMSTVMLPTEILINSLYIFNNNSILISRDKIFVNRKEMYGIFLESEGINYDEWIKTMFDINGRERSAFKPGKLRYSFDGNSSNTSQRNVIYYIIPLPNNFYNDQDGIIVYLLDFENIIELLSYEEISNYGFIYITDKNGQNVLNYQCEDIDSRNIGKNNGLGPFSGNTPINEGALPINTGIVDMRINKIDYTVMAVNQSKSGLKMAVGIQNWVFTKRIENTMYLLRVFYILSIIVGLVATFFFSYRSSTPIRKLLSTVTVIANIPSSKKAKSKKTNAYEYINDTLIELNDERKKFSMEIAHLGNSIRTSIFDKLLINRVFSYDDICEINKYVNFVNDPFIIVVLKFFNYTGNYHENSNDELVKVMAINEINQLLPSNCFIHSVIPDKLIILFPIRNHEFCNSSKESKTVPDKEVISELKAKLSLVIYEIAKRTSINAKAGISLVGKGYGNVYICYSQAMDILRLADNNLKEPVFIYSGENDEIQEVLFSIKDVQKFYELMLSGEKAKVEESIDEFYGRVVRLKCIQDHIMRSIYYNIRNIIMFISKEVLKETDKLINFQEYSEEKTARQLFDQLKEKALVACEIINSKKKSRNTQLKEDIINYLKDNYYDINLCAVSVADHFGIAEKYIFNFVKEQTGKSFGEYLESIRLEKATGLLQNTCESIDRIAEICGFNSYNTFYKAFRRGFGVSPGVWKDGSRNK